MMSKGGDIGVAIVNRSFDQVVVSGIFFFVVVVAVKSNIRVFVRQCHNKGSLAEWHTHSDVVGALPLNNSRGLTFKKSTPPTTITERQRMRKIMRCNISMSARRWYSLWGGAIICHDDSRGR